MLRMIEAALTHPGFLACALLRAQQYSYSLGMRRAAGFLRLVANSLTGADFLPGCTIGGGLTLHHPTGVVIGSGAIIGQNCTIMQGVTIGEKHASTVPPHDYPHLGDNVIIGAGAKILGKVVIDDDARIAANSVVLIDVPRGRLAAGIPAELKSVPGLGTQ